MTPKIREANEHDIPALVELFSESEEFHRTNRPDFFAKPTDSDLVHAFKTFMSDKSVVSLATEVDRKIHAYARYRTYCGPATSFLVHSGQKQALIDELVVSSQFRRKGLGKQLMLEIERRLKEECVDLIQLNVFSFNHSAQALYESLGYQRLYTRLGKSFDNR